MLLGMGGGPQGSSEEGLSWRSPQEMKERSSRKGERKSGEVGLWKCSPRVGNAPLPIQHCPDVES